MPSKFECTAFGLGPAGTTIRIATTARTISENLLAAVIAQINHSN
jgi:hypothetical protein